MILLHRYLGIGIGVLMLMWCITGVVMMYVPYPNFEERARIAALAPIDWALCCGSGTGSLPEDAPVDVARIEMMGDRLYAAVWQGDRRQIIDLDTGAALQRISSDQALARRFASAVGLPAVTQDPELQDLDQWTVAGELSHDRPLYRFTWQDRDGSALYVSSVSGQAKQFTTRHVRTWNWLGAIPHWLYFTELRRHAQAWTWVVDVASLLGCFLTATGIYVGIRQWWRCERGGGSPYRGFMVWHHVPGLFCGVFALTWVLSGLLSMNPSGLLEGDGMRADLGRVRGAPPSWGEVKSALNEFKNHRHLETLLSLRAAVLDGRLFFIATSCDGRETRLKANGSPAPLTGQEVAAIAGRLGNGAQTRLELLPEGDEYYYRYPDGLKRPEVYRIVSQNADVTRYYVDAITGDILLKADKNTRAYRWWHDALHRLDISKAIRSRPLWDFIMWALLLGVSCVAATGCYGAVRRVSGYSGRRSKSGS